MAASVTPLPAAAASVALVGASGRQWLANGAALGRGKYGAVRRGADGVSGTAVALKEISKQNFKVSSSAAWRIEREVQLHRRLGRHANVVELLDVAGDTQRDDTVTLVLELCEGGDILQQIQKLERIPEAQSRAYFVQLVGAMAHAHALGVVHRDLKVENILLDATGNVKLADWGFAGAYGAANNNGLLSEFYGSLPYASPEIVTGTPYVGPEVDVWSTGVVLYAMTTGHFPFHGSTDRSVARRIVAACYAMPDFLSPDLQHLIRSLLVPDASQRPSMFDILHHPWCRDALHLLPVELQHLLLRPVRSMSAVDGLVAADSDDVAAASAAIAQAQAHAAAEAAAAAAAIAAAAAAALAVTAASANASAGGSSDVDESLRRDDSVLTMAETSCGSPSDMSWSSSSTMNSVAAADANSHLSPSASTSAAAKQHLVLPPLPAVSTAATASPSMRQKRHSTGSSLPLPSPRQTSPRMRARVSQLWSRLTGRTEIR